MYQASQNSNNKLRVSKTNEKGFDMIKIILTTAPTANVRDIKRKEHRLKEAVCE